MHIQVLYFEECPNYKDAIKNLETSLEQKGLKASTDIDLQLVKTEQEANKLKFIGSPTFLVDGQDLFGVPEESDYGLRCRIFLIDDRATAVPTVEDFNDALKSKS